MPIEMKLPIAFSLRDENEFFPVQHLMARLNSKFIVVQVATGVHVDGDCTVLWGLIYLEGQPIAKSEVEKALQEAGFDFTHGSIQTFDFLPPQPEETPTAAGTTTARS